MKKIFIGYGYNEKDKWIEDLVFDLVRAFEFEPVAGKEIYGKDLSQGVKDLIRDSYALLGFTTRREDPKGQQEGTHRWVTDELTTAQTLDVPFVEIREDGISQGGIVGSNQYIHYNEAQRDKCLVEIAKALGIWRQELPIRIKLIPDELINMEIQPKFRKPGFRCTYRVIEGFNPSNPREAQLIPMTGGLFVQLSGLSREALVSISIEYAGKTWSSVYESVVGPSIKLHPQE